METPAENLITVRATMNLPGLRAGRLADVNPDLPWIRQYLDSTALVPVDADAGTADEKVASIQEEEQVDV